MKKIFRYAFVASLGALALGFSSCDDKYEYTPASAADLGGNAFMIPAESTELVLTEDDEQAFTVTVSRVDSTKAEVIALTSDNDKFNAPTQVEFAAGEKSKTAVVTFNIAPATQEKVNIRVSEKDAFDYGLPELGFTVTRLAAKSAIMAYGLFGTQAETTLYYVGNQYIIPADYENGYEADINFTWNEDNTIVLPLQAAWTHPTYGDIYIIGNANGDAAVTASGVNGSGVAGSYDPEESMITLNLYHAVPGVGSFGTYPDYILITE